jgi:hypothetical protein
MDQEDIELGIAEAIGKASAAMSIETALIRLLKRKAMLTGEDVATLAGEAEMALTAMVGLSEEAMELALSALRGCSKSWTKAVTKN